MKKREKILLNSLVKGRLFNPGVEVCSGTLGALVTGLEEGHQQGSFSQSWCLLDYIILSKLTLSGTLEVVAELGNADGKAWVIIFRRGFHSACGVLERFGTVLLSKINCISIK